MRSRAARRFCAAAVTNTKRRRRTCRSSKHSGSGRTGRAPSSCARRLARPPPKSPSSRPRSRRSSARCSPTPPLSPGEERLRLFDNAARFLQSLAARARAAGVRRRRALGRSGNAVAAALPAAPSAQRARARARRVPRDRARPRASARFRARRMESRAPGDAHRARPLVPRRHRQRCSRRSSAQESVSDDFASALYRETEGNPFFIEEVIKSLIEQGQIYREGERWGPQGDARARDPAKRQGGDRAAAQAPERADGRRAADRRRARQDLPRSASWRPCRRERGCAARCARRSERGAAHPRQSRRRRARARQRRKLRLHARQDSRSAVRGAEPDSPPPPAPAHRRNAGDAPRRREHGASEGRARTSTPRISPITSRRPAIWTGR